MIFHIYELFCTISKENIRHVKILETNVKYEYFTRSLSYETYCNYEHINKN